MLKRKKIWKGYTPNSTEEIFIITDQLNTSPVTYSIKNLKVENIEGSFYEPELQKTSQEVFRIERVIKQDSKKKLALVKWMGYDERFNSWVKLSELKKYKNIYFINLIYKKGFYIIGQSLWLTVIKNIICFCLYKGLNLI